MWTAGITNSRDFALAVAAFCCCILAGDAMLVVVLSALGAAALAYLPHRCDRLHQPLRLKYARAARRDHISAKAKGSPSTNRAPHVLEVLP